MDRDLTNLKKWLNNLGLEVDGKISDENLKKLVPPQRRDMWRNIVKHVLPKEEVDLIKKSILLHQLQKRQKPLKAKIESNEDLSNALKYEELITEYNKVQKEIIDAKINNNKLKTDLNEKYECKKNAMKSIELKQTSSYLANQKISLYNACIEDFNKFYNLCNVFSIETNESLSKTDYEDSLIKCFTEVDDAKQYGTMKDSVDIGKHLCNSIYTTLCDKSPSTLIQTIEGNLSDQINISYEVTIDTIEAVTINDNETVFDELIKTFFETQLKLHSKLSERLMEKENAIKHLEETTNLVQNEIISQYKLKNISFTDQELLAFKKNLKNAFDIIFKISNGQGLTNNDSKVGFQEKFKFEEETFIPLDDILKLINKLNDEMDERKTIVCEMLKELDEKKSDFGLMELKIVIDKLAEAYLKKIDNSNPINKTISSLKKFSSYDVNYINKLVLQPTTKVNVINFWTLQNIKRHTETIDVISEITTKFEQFNNILPAESKLIEISKKESLHISEFDSFINEIENKMLELDCIIEDSKTLADILISKQLPNVSTNE